MSKSIIHGLDKLEQIFNHRNDFFNKKKDFRILCEGFDEEFYESEELKQQSEICLILSTSLCEQLKAKVSGKVIQNPEGVDWSKTLEEPEKILKSLQDLTKVTNVILKSKKEFREQRKEQEIWLKENMEQIHSSEEEEMKIEEISKSFQEFLVEHCEELINAKIIKNDPDLSSFVENLAKNDPYNPQSDFKVEEMKKFKVSEGPSNEHKAREIVQEVVQNVRNYCEIKQKE